MLPEINLGMKYIYIINNDLKMSKGKIAAQVSHIAMMISKEYNCVIGRAVVLKASEQLMRDILEEYPMEVFYIEDVGLTQVPEGSLTCIGFLYQDYFRPIVNELKLV